jgi:hypothetical protein
VPCVSHVVPPGFSEIYAGSFSDARPKALERLAGGKNEKPAGWRAFVYLSIVREIGAGEGIRTLDPNLGKVVLYP